MVTTEAYFKNIKTEILKELDLANQSIYVAVAWFTDHELYSKLLEKQNAGCLVYLIIADDKINKSTKLNFDTISNQGGFFKYISGELMHNKFCIIDKKIVITGSYNWTNNASLHNQENITITQGDFDLAFRFIEQFKTIAGLGETKRSTIDYSMLIKRLRIVVELIGLGDEEDIQYQCKRLAKEELDEELKGIVELINIKQFEKALERINSFISTKSSLTIYIDPRIYALQLDIKNLELRIISIDDECADLTRLIHEFNTEYYKVLGDIIEKILKAKEAYFKKHRHENPKKEEEYQESKEEREEFGKDKNAIEADPSIELNEEDKAKLKKMHREGALLCHPDKVSDELKDRANVTFQELQSAYERNDIARLSEILTKVRSGIWTEKRVDISDLKILEMKKEHLEKSLKNKLDQRAELSDSPIFKEIGNIKRLEEYLLQKKNKLEIEYRYWLEKNG